MYRNGCIVTCEKNDRGMFTLYCVVGIKYSSGLVGRGADYLTPVYIHLVAILISYLEIISLYQ